MRYILALLMVVSSVINANASQEPIREPKVGSCECPYDMKSNGRRCGGNSSYSRPGGTNPVCFQSESNSPISTDEVKMIEAIRCAAYFHIKSTENNIPKDKSARFNSMSSAIISFYLNQKTDVDPMGIFEYQIERIAVEGYKEEVKICS